MGGPHSGASRLCDGQRCQWGPHCEPASLPAVPATGQLARPPPHQPARQPARQPASASGGSSRRRPPLSPRLQVHCAHRLHRLLLPPGGGGARLCQRDRSLLPAAHPRRPAQGVPPLHDSHPHRCGWPSDPRVRRAPAAAPTGSGTRPLPACAARWWPDRAPHTHTHTHPHPHTPIHTHAQAGTLATRSPPSSPRSRRRPAWRAWGGGGQLAR